MTSRVKRAKYKAARGPYATTPSSHHRQVYSPGREGRWGREGRLHSQVEYGNVQLQGAARVYLQRRKTVPPRIVIPWTTRGEGA